MKTTRREALAAGAAACVAAALPPVRADAAPAAPKMKLSLAAYSYRDYLGAKPAPTMTMMQFVDEAAKLPLDAVELTSYWFPDRITPEYLSELRRHCYLSGLDISGSPVRNEFTYPAGPKRDAEIAHVKKWLDYASLLGSPTMRIFAGSQQPGDSLETAKQHCVECIAECCGYAATKGVLLALENHGGIVAEADDIIQIVRSVNSKWCGINLDTGNFRTADPYGDMAKCAGMAVSVQVKTEIQAKGAQKQLADLKREVAILRDAGYKRYVTLEYEAAEEPKLAVPRILDEMRALLG